MTKEIRVGLVGYKFMGKAHSNAYMTVAKFFDLNTAPVMKAVCGRDAAAVSAFAERFGWQSSETDWRTLIAREDIDLIDISAPSNVHAEIAIAAANAGKHVLCEKPLAATLTDAKAMLAAVRSSGVQNMVNFSYRCVPAIALAREMIAAGELGEIRHFRGTYLQDWINDPSFPMNWRLRKEIAGSGSHGDLNAHHVDLARFLVGEMDEVIGMNKTFIEERPAEGESTGLSAKAGQGTERVTVDDCTMFMAKFANGALGTFEATRVAAGRKNYNRFEINGSLGSIAFCFERMNVLEYFSTSDATGRQGFREIIATEGEHPYAGNWWPPGHMLGYDHTFVNATADLMNAFDKDQPAQPSFLDGARCVSVLEAVDTSIESKSWQPVECVE